MPNLGLRPVDQRSRVLAGVLVSASLALLLGCSGDGPSATSQEDSGIANVRLLLSTTAADSISFESALATQGGREMEIDTGTFLVLSKAGSDSVRVLRAGTTTNRFLAGDTVWVSLRQDRRVLAATPFVVPLPPTIQDLSNPRSDTTRYDWDPRSSAFGSSTDSSYLDVGVSLTDFGGALLSRSDFVVDQAGPGHFTVGSAFASLPANIDSARVEIQARKFVQLHSGAARTVYASSPVPSVRFDIRYSGSAGFVRKINFSAHPQF